jgi:NADH:ubiquinone oxidoreductase subunit 6 (subunit J)
MNQTRLFTVLNLTVLFLLIIILACTILLILSRDKKTLMAIYYTALIFFSSAFLFLCLVVTEYFSMLYLLIYLGAIMVLYIISIYTVGSNFLDHFEKLTKQQYLVNCIVISLISFFSMTFFFKATGFFFIFGFNKIIFIHNYFDILYLHNNSKFDTLSFILFDYCPISALLGGLILLLALMGAIMLTRPSHHFI